MTAQLLAWHAPKILPCWPIHAVYLYPPVVTIGPTYDDQALLEIIAAYIGDREFSVRQLLRHAEVVDGELRRAIGTRSGKQLGKWLERMAKATDDVVCIGRDHDGLIWRVRL